MSKSYAVKKHQYDPSWIDGILPDILVTPKKDKYVQPFNTDKFKKQNLKQILSSADPELNGDGYDLWSSEKGSSTPSVNVSRQGNDLTVKGYCTRKEREVKRPMNLPLTVEELHPVPLPHSGQSINPSSEAYTDALHIATDKLLRRQRKLNDATYFCDKIRPKEETLTRQQVLEDHALQSTITTEEPNDGDDVYLLTKARPKTEKQRRRQREHQMRESLVSERKKRRKREADVEHWDELRAEVLQEKEERHARYLEKKKKLRIGSHKYVPKALDVHPNPTARLSSNGHEYVTHPMEERLQSYQVRGVIPPVSNARRNKKFRTISRYRWTFRKD